MGVYRGNHPIDSDTRLLISKRYKTITKAVNGDFGIRIQKPPIADTLGRMDEARPSMSATLMF